MANYDVVIIGGGVSGLSCAITLGSAAAKEAVAADKKILVIDAGASHLKIAQVFNVPGIKPGTVGTELLASLADQANAYENVTLTTGNVTKVAGDVGAYTISTEAGENYEAGLIVFANGMATINVEGIGADVVDHVRAPRPGMVMIQNENGKIDDGKYVTGCAAGATSMFAAAAGYGAQTGTDIISAWIGKYTVIHDVAKKG